MEDMILCIKKIGSRTICLSNIEEIGNGNQNGHATCLIGDVGTLTTIFCMMRLTHSVNGGGDPPKYQSLYLYSLMLNSHLFLEYL